MAMNYEHTRDSYQPYREEYYSENAYCNSGGSSLQQVKPYPNITTSQPSQHHVVFPDAYDHQNGYGGGGYCDNYSNYIIKDGHLGNPPHRHDYNMEHESHGNKHHHGFYGRNNYDTYETHGFSKYSHGPNRGESMTSYNYYASEGTRDHHQKWAPNEAAQWIVKALDD